MTEILAGGFLPGVKPHWREDSIFDAAACVCCQTASFCVVESGDSLNKTDRADGNKIFLFGVRVQIFLCHMSNQTQVALNQYIFCLKVALPVFLKIFPFFLRCERLLKSLHK